MTLKYGIPRREYEGFSRDELEATASNQGLSVSESDSDEQIVDRLVESSYPIYPMPTKIDPQSPRGVVFSSVLDPENNPRANVSVSDMIARLIEIGVPDEATADQMVHQQVENLVRMYGYTIKRSDEQAVTLARR